MNSGDAQVNLIITKATQLGLVCQKDETNKWTIYLKQSWVLSQINREWILFVWGEPEMYMFNSEVLKLLDQWDLYAQ